MTDSINKILAALFAKFKQKSPIFASVLLLLLGTINYSVGQAATLGLDVPEWTLKVVEWLSLLLVALTGSQTYQYLKKDNEPEQNV